MAQDIRELLKEDRGIPREKLRSGHEKRFYSKLDAHFGPQDKSQSGVYLWLKIAAVLIVVLAIGGFLFTNNWVKPDPETQVVSTTPNETDAQVQLSDLSPEFKRVEDYYLASINVELAQLKVTEDNKALIDSFMSQLEELNNEYSRLNDDLVEVGVNEQTIAALIDNLKLRLDLLFKLKDKLAELNEASDLAIESNRI